LKIDLFVVNETGRELWLLVFLRKNEIIGRYREGFFSHKIKLVHFGVLVTKPYFDPGLSVNLLLECTKDLVCAKT
jgi:hypothetical protein